jgi:hypothetical protein
MKTNSKIGLSIGLFFLSLFGAFLGYAIASSSHNVNHDGGAMFSMGSLILGGLGIIATWLPWKKMLKKKE